MLSIPAATDRRLVAVSMCGITLFCAGQLVVGYFQALSVIVSGIGLVMLAFWASRKQRSIIGSAAVSAGAFLVSALPIGIAPTIFSPVLAYAFRSNLPFRTLRLAPIILGGIAFGLLAFCGVWLWWSSRAEITFWTFLPLSLATSLPAPIVVLACATGALFNAVWEEILWRRLLIAPFRSINGRFATVFGVLVLSASFGLAHINSMPNGWGGVALTAIFAVAAHVVSLRSKGGIMVAVIAHFFADVTLLLLISL